MPSALIEKAVERNTSLTEPFMTLDDVGFGVLARWKRGGELRQVFRMAKDIKNIHKRTSGTSVGTSLCELNICHS